MTDQTLNREMFGNGHPPVIPFLTAGFPNQRIFLDAASAVADAGAGALEIGMPFSDPLADGPAIQQSSQVALSRGVTLATVLDMTASITRKISIPVFLMGYLNPVLRYGYDRFARDARAAGVAGTIIPDCPLEEAKMWREASRRNGLVNIFLIAPTSLPDRIRQIDRASTVFSYCVAVAGVTGARSGVTPATKAYLRRVRTVARKPFVVGFGISKPDHIRLLAPFADGFVVGSALVPLLASRNPKLGPQQVARAVKSLVKAAG